jgi:hypothetical protein
MISGRRPVVIGSLLFGMPNSLVFLAIGKKFAFKKYQEHSRVLVLRQ